MDRPRHSISIKLKMSSLSKMMWLSQNTRYVHVLFLAHFRNHFVPVVVDSDMPILVQFQIWHNVHSILYIVTNAVYANNSRYVHANYGRWSFVPITVYISIIMVECRL